MNLEALDSARVIESSLFQVPEVPGHITRLTIPGVSGWMTSVNLATANLVGMSHFGSDASTVVIRQVIEAYAQQEGGLSFTWVVGPGSEPPDLRESLRLAGFRKVDELAGMVLDDCDVAVPSNPRFEIREAGSEEMHRAAVMMAQAFNDVPVALAVAIDGAFGEGNAVTEAKSYLAYDKEQNRPVAYGYLHLQGPYAVLRNAATLPEYRRQGVYSMMVAHRLEASRRFGRHRAVIQATRGTTAPICARLGFREVCNLELYALHG